MPAVAFASLKDDCAAWPELAEELKCTPTCLKIPGEVRLVAELPKAAAGKIKRFLLRKMLLKK